MMTYVYRVRNDGCFEVGVTNLPVKDINRTSMGDMGWCDSRICETWDEGKAIQIVNALQRRENE